MLNRYSRLAYHVRDQILDLVLAKRGDNTWRLEDLARKFEVSRTPAREALADLGCVGLVEPMRYRGFRGTFRGPDDIHTRVRILTAALTEGETPEPGKVPQRIANAAGGQWAEVQWAVLSAWPRNAHHWGLDGRRALPLLEDATARIDAATSAVEIADAVRAYGVRLVDLERQSLLSSR
ncbi:MAG: hypothetical protein V4737_10950 [Curtobacterium sp.]